MGLFTRAIVTGQVSLPYRARSGEGFLDNVIVATLADAAGTVTVAQMAGGVLQGNFTAGRALTTPTAVLILASAADMDIGDSFMILVSMVAAFAATWTGGVGVTLLGRATSLASTSGFIVVTRTGAATVSWNVL